MFSNIGNVFTGSKPREAETTDTRLGIRRHDPDQERRKKSADEEDAEPLFSEEDDTVVSIEALRVFLENFLRAQMDMDKKRADRGKVPGADKEFSQKSGVKNFAGGKAAQAAQAANAYQNTAQAAAQKSTFDSTPPESPGMEIESQDVRIIHGLLNDLKILSDNNVQTLRIEKGVTFLQSLAAATQKAKAMLG